MTATLTFDLNDHDERQAHMRCVKALDMAIALWDIENKLKDRCEGILSRYPEQYQKGLDVALEHVRMIISDHNINLNELIS
jgi:hypothetical protein